MYKTLLEYPGGKSTIIKKLLYKIPIHKHYVEVFGGAGSLLFAKKLSTLETFNDANKDLYNFFCVLRDENQNKKLKKLLINTFYEKNLYENLRKKYDNIDNSVEKAWAYFVLNRLSFNGEGKSSGWSYSINSGSSKAKIFNNKIKQIDWFIKRLRNVQIDSEDFRKILNKYDSTETFFYLDPPYVQFEVSRNLKKYYGKNAMSDKDHKDLVEILLQIKGKALLSGYKNSIYEKLIVKGWNTKDIDIYKGMINSKNAKNIKHKETLWWNYGTGNKNNKSGIFLRLK